MAIFRLFYEQYIELSATVAVCMIFSYEDITLDNMETEDRVSLVCCAARRIFVLCIHILITDTLYTVKDVLDLA